jgi:mRNA-degrading endonuclease RelE of RelBE toxin-antitoxin system
MSHRIIISKSVQKQIDALPNEMSDRVAEKLQQLAEEPRPLEFRLIGKEKQPNRRVWLLNGHVASIMIDHD